MHGRGGKDLYIDVPIGTLVYKLIYNNQALQQSDSKGREALRSFEEQMHQHMGNRYEEVYGNASNSSSNAAEEIRRELLFDSSFAKPHELYCVAYGGKGGEGNHDWYETSKRKHLHNWGSNRDRRLQATYYKVGLRRRNQSSTTNSTIRARKVNR